MEEVCERENLKEALRRVKANKGSAGVDGMTTGAITVKGAQIQVCLIRAVPTGRCQKTGA
jgi:riboflavin synthase alpha subunit